MENQRLREQVKELKKSNRLQLLMEISQENIELEEVVKSQNVWIAYLEARLKRNVRSTF
ncbi:hypothetical protein AABM38_20570 [Heyndrickxia sp. MSNUG]|uniref:hypothetical protein n=1 Tax=Heyndrickxia sp. MSNUG TaxID=3136677 RepID=UPI003C2BE9E9